MRDTAEIISILKEFYSISGFRISIHDLEHNEIYAYPPRISEFCKTVQNVGSVKKKCIENDKRAFLRVKETEETYVYKCHCGLYEAVAPIYHFGVLSGYLMMGQIRDTVQQSLSVIRKSLSNAGLGNKEIDTAVSNIKAIESELIPCYVNIMKMVAEHITATGKIGYSGENAAELIKKFINRNYRSKISLALLSQKLGCSNSTMMKRFKEEYGITIADYINEVRLKNAEKFLIKSSKSVKEISAECGFSDQNYFSRRFSEKYGISPTEFRKQHIKN